MEDTSKKVKEPKKLADLQDDIISAQSKTISALEENTRLLREQIALKEKMHRMELEERSTIHIVPAHNGSNGVEVNV